MTCHETILHALTRPLRSSELCAALDYYPRTVRTALLELQRAGAVQRRGLRYVRVGDWTRPRIGQPRAPDGAMAAGEALGISRQWASELIKAKRLVFTEEGWVRR